MIAQKSTNSHLPPIARDILRSLGLGSDKQKGAGDSPRFADALRSRGNVQSNNVGPTRRNPRKRVEIGKSFSRPVRTTDGATANTDGEANAYAQHTEARSSHDRMENLLSRTPIGRCSSVSLWVLVLSPCLASFV